MVYDIALYHSLDPPHDEATPLAVPYHRHHSHRRTSRPVSFITHLNYSVSHITRRNFPLCTNNDGGVAWGPSLSRICGHELQAARSWLSDYENSRYVKDVGTW